MNTLRAFAIALLIGSVSVIAWGQPQMLKRTTTKTDKFEFGAGGTLAVAGAPNGSIHIIGSSSGEIEISAEIEVNAANEADLAKLASVTSFVTEETILRVGIISVGTSNKLGAKSLWKKFPKNLMALPYRIDYVIHVPRFCDLEIDGGKGDLIIEGVEGSMRINYIETNARVDVINGSVLGTFGAGTVQLGLGVGGWRGRAANVQLAKGDMTVRLPSNTSAEIDALILRTGAIENLLTDLKPRDRKVLFTDRSIIAKAGVGGPPLKFTVGDGNLKLERLTRQGI